MKTFIFVFIQLSFVISSISQTVFIFGEVKNLGENKEVSVFYYNNSIEWVLETAEKVTIDNNGNFSMQFPWHKASHADLLIGDEHTDMFLIPGDSIHLTTDYNNFDSTINYSGRGAADNNYLAKELIQNFKNKARVRSNLTEANFYKNYVDSIWKENQKFYNSYPSKGLSDEFKKFIETTIKYRYIDTKWMFSMEYNPTTNKIEKKDLPKDYFDFLKTIDLNDDKSLDIPEYTVSLDRYIEEKIDFNNDKSIADTLSETKKKELKMVKLYYFIKQILNDKVLDYKLTEWLYRLIKYSTNDTKIVDDLITDYKATCKNPEFVSIIDKTYIQIKQLTKGSIPPPFTLINEDGKKVSLNDFKGKIVYIDFWSTACVPCRLEMPDSKKLIEKYKDKEIVFLYVNIEDNMESWIKYLEKNKEGMHIYADREQSKNLMHDYGFDGIPHFVLIDREGKLINANAERPSGKADKEIAKALGN
jgi:thiol-disulfide isomerase/thioredoxin